MPAIIHSKDILVGYYNNSAHPAWARDLICKAINTNGTIEETDLDFILDEILNGVSRPSLTIPENFGVAYPKIELNRLKHVSGVNALADNQAIEFCEEGITLIFGFNGSGKSSYFKLLNMMANADISYPVLQNIYAQSPAPFQVELDYSVLGTRKTYKWTGSPNFPPELTHIRFFDANYSKRLLQPHECNTYLFESYFLKLFQSINDAAETLNSLGAISLHDYNGLKTLCNNTICSALKNALLQQFRKELDSLGMNYLQVGIEMDDLMLSTAKIKFKILSNTNVEQILSEAELKCASLALFIAENVLLDVNQPLVFDDPVTSLDAQYVENFLNRIISLPNQVILFTHSVQLQTLFLDKDKDKIKIYPNNSVATNRTATNKKHVLVYEVLSDNPKCNGCVIGHNVCKSLYYLDKADGYLRNVPLRNAQEVIDYLRHAIEWMIDEVVFRNKSPLKFRGRSNIPWAELMAIVDAGSQIVISLRDAYNKLSNHGTHVGMGSVMQNLTRQDLIDISTQLRQIYDNANL